MVIASDKALDGVREIRESLPGRVTTVTDKLVLSHPARRLVVQGWHGVSILGLAKGLSLICSFYLSVAERTIV